MILSPAQSSSRPPDVVLIILDEFPGDAIARPDGQVDAVRFPGFGALAATSTRFPNASTVFDDTRQAVPAILDGRLPRPGGSRGRGDHPLTIYDAFGLRGYRIVANEEATGLCPPRWCPAGGTATPDVIRNLQGVRPRRMARFVRAIRRTRRPTLYVKHVLLPHVPYLFLPSGRRTRNGVRDPIPGMNSPRGFHDGFLTQHNQQRFLLQLGAVDREIVRLLRRLRRLGTLDRTVIAVTADHGVSFERGVRDRRLISRGNIDEVGPVPLFFKAAGQRRGRTNRAYARNVDVLPTLANLARVGLPFGTSGRSAFGRAARARRRVRIPTRSFSRTVVIGGRAWERRRRALRRRQAARFGSGPLASLYTGIGPHRALLGQTIVTLRPARLGRPRAMYVMGRRTRAVRRRSGLVPTHLAGTIRGGRRGAWRNVAAAVNGRIEAVGRTWRLRGTPGERFALNIPEAALREGRNRVELFEVSRDGRRLRTLGRP